MAELADRLVEEGWERDAAQVEARRRFGDAARYVPTMARLEEGRMAREKRTLWWDMLQESLASVARTARRYPGFTAGVIATLGLGLGANATMYGIVDRLLLRPPAHIVAPDQVKLVFLERPGLGSPEPTFGSSATYPDYTDLTGHSGMDVAAFTGAAPLTVGRGRDAHLVPTAIVTPGFFEMLGVSARAGRFFDESEGAVGAPLTAVVSEEYWNRAFGGDPAALGATLEVQGHPATIVGVAPEGFTGTDLAPVDIWLPLAPMHVLQNDGDGCLTSRGCWWMRIVARLHEGVDVAAAEAEATALHLNARRDMIDQGRYPEEARYALGPVIAAQGPGASDEARVAAWLAGVSAVVLLIACANVANLLLARGTRRQREVGVRLALGASRRRVVGQTVLESVILALAGGVVALLLARWGGAIVRSTLLPGVSFPHDSWSGRLVAFIVGTSVLAGLAAGLAPALAGRRSDLAGTLAGGSRGASGRRSALRSSLTVAQAALSVVLLVGAGLFVRSLSELRALDLGLDVDRLVVITLELDGSDRTVAEQREIYREAARRVAGVPGVRSTAHTAVPFQWGYAAHLRIPGHDSIPRLPGGGPYYFPVSAGYFETVGVSMVEGRPLRSSDGPDDDRVAVVSATMARTLWPSESALGRCLLVGQDAEQCTTVVGVAEDAARGGYQDDPFMAYYLPDVQLDLEPRALYVRTEGPAPAQVASVVGALQGFAPGVRFVHARPLQDLLDPQARAWTLGATLFSVFGLLALVLAAIGLYSMLAFDVAQRTRELGIRAALGADKGRLLRSVVGQGGRLAMGGVALGSVVAWVAAPYAADLLFQVSPRDPSTLAIVAAVLLVVSLAASVVPGIRATAVEPTEALASE